MRYMNQGRSIVATQKELERLARAVGSLAMLVADLTKWEPYLKNSDREILELARKTLEESKNESSQ